MAPNRIARLLGGLAALLCIFLAIPALAGTPVVRAQQQGTRQSPPYDATQVTVPTTPPLALVGQPIYQENCAPCHGELGMGDGPTAADLPSPPTAFADPAAIQERSPAQLFHTTKFGRLEKLMPPWQNELSDDQIWQTVAYAWSLHTSPAQIERGQELYAQSCASCHGEQGRGDGPDAEGALMDFSDPSYAIFRSQRRAAKPAEMRDAYTTLNPGTLTTPESLQLSPRALPQPQAATDEQQEDETR